MASVAFEKLLGKAVDRGASYLFDEAINKYGEEEGLSEDEKRYIQETIELVVEFEKLYRYYIASGDSYTVEDFKREITPLGRTAAELAAVGDLRSYSDRDVEALENAVSVALFFEQHIPDATEILDHTEPSDADDIEREIQKPTISDFYSETKIPRELIETIAQGDHIE